ncbi:N-acetyltransferase [Bacteroidales bacterium OttesenSCG-928-M11]|nr:N-acetyltransferase [Bacteroidales bacterium OttesenSCG-928-M11]
MKVTREESGKRGAFNAIEDDKKIGKMSYFWGDENTFVIDHTGINTAFQGQGVGKKLFLSAIDYAREKNCKIVPACSFAASMFRRHPECADVLK